jgi:hypothetical protein
MEMVGDPDIKPLLRHLHFWTSFTTISPIIMTKKMKEKKYVKMRPKNSNHSVTSGKKFSMRV